MTKFVNRIDHVAWMSRIENIEKNVRDLEHLFDVKFESPAQSDDLGFTMYLCWEAGLEVIAPHTVVTDFNTAMHDHLKARGEGPYAIVFGVKDLAARRDRLIELGYKPSEAWNGDAPSPWSHKLKLKELDGEYLFNTRMIFGEIDYADGIISIEQD